MSEFLTNVATGITADALFSPVLFVIKTAVQTQLNAAFAKSTAFSTLSTSLTSRLSALADILKALPPTTPVAAGPLNNLKDAVTEAHDLLVAFQGGNKALSALRQRWGHVERFRRVHARLDSAIADLHLATAAGSQALSWDPSAVESAVGDLHKELGCLEGKVEEGNVAMMKIMANVEAMMAQNRASVAASLTTIARCEVEREVEVGRGAFGAVYMARWAGTIAAEKSLNGGQMSEQDQKAFLGEAELMAKNRHPNVVSLYGIVNDSSNSSLIMEYVAGGSLSDLLYGSDAGEDGDSGSGSGSGQAVGALSALAAGRIGLEIAKGLAHVHGRGIVHRDVKSANVLISSNWDCVKVTDFGLSRAKTTQSVLKSHVGTSKWMAPEVHGDLGHDSSADVYSWAVTMSELLTGSLPFEGVANVPLLVQAGNMKPSLPAAKDMNGAVPGLHDLICRSWDRSPQRRPSMKEIVRELSGMLEAKGALECPIGSLVTRRQYTLWSSQGLGSCQPGSGGVGSGSGSGSGSGGYSSQVSSPGVSSVDMGTGRGGSASGSASGGLALARDGEELLVEGWVEGLVTASGGEWSEEEARSKLGPDGGQAGFLRLIPLAVAAGQVARAGPRVGDTDGSAETEQQQAVLSEWLKQHSGLNPVDGVGLTGKVKAPASVAAVVENRVDVLQGLVKCARWSKGSFERSRDEQGFNALEVAMRLDRVDCVRFLTEMGLDVGQVRAHGRNSSIGGAGAGSGAGAGQRMVSAVDIGAGSGSIKALRTVLSYHVAHSDADSAAALATDASLGWAARGGHVKIVELLQQYRGEHQAMTVVNGWSLLCLAASGGHSAAVTKLGSWLRTELELRGAAGAAGGDSWTALHGAVWSGDMETVKAVVGVAGSVCGRKGGLRVVKDLMKQGQLKEVMSQDGNGGGRGDDVFWKDVRALLRSDRALRVCFGSSLSKSSGMV